MSNWVGPYSIVVGNGVLQNSSDVFFVLDPDVGGRETFSVPLSPNGLEPVTHWGCRTMLRAEAYTALTTMGNPEFMGYVNGLAAERGRTPVGSVTAFKNSMRIDGTMRFKDFIATLGLQVVEPPEEVA